MSKSTLAHPIGRNADHSDNVLTRAMKAFADFIVELRCAIQSPGGY